MLKNSGISRKIMSETISDFLIDHFMNQNASSYFILKPCLKQEFLMGLTVVIWIIILPFYKQQHLQAYLHFLHMLSAGKTNTIRCWLRRFQKYGFVVFFSELFYF
jgi:hypothetical protein